MTNLTSDLGKLRHASSPRSRILDRLLIEWFRGTRFELQSLGLQSTLREKIRGRLCLQMGLQAELRGDFFWQR